MRKVFKIHKPSRQVPGYTITYLPSVTRVEDQVLDLLRSLWPPDRTFDRMLFTRMEMTLIATHDATGALAGTASGGFSREGMDPYVHWVAVHPEHRRRGLARALVMSIVEQFFADFDTVFVATNPTTEENEAFYRTLGFVDYDLGDV